jgi:hypothetical protein
MKSKLTLEQFLDFIVSQKIGPDAFVGAVIGYDSKGGKVAKVEKLLLPGEAAVFLLQLSSEAEPMTVGDLLNIVEPFTDEELSLPLALLKDMPSVSDWVCYPIGDFFQPPDKSSACVSLYTYGDVIEHLGISRPSSN